MYSGGGGGSRPTGRLDTANQLIDGRGARTNWLEKSGE
jgi:hypothetical protein